MDNAAIIPIWCNLDYLLNIKNVNITVKWGNSSLLKINKTGKIKIIYTNTGIIEYINNVYFIANMGINILSVAPLFNYIITFINNKVEIKKKENIIIMEGKK